MGSVLYTARKWFLVNVSSLKWFGSTKCFLVNDNSHGLVLVLYSDPIITNQSAVHDTGPPQSSRLETYIHISTDFVNHPIRDQYINNSCLPFLKVLANHSWVFLQLDILIRVQSYTIYILDHYYDWLVEGYLILDFHWKITKTNSEAYKIVSMSEISRLFAAFTMGTVSLSLKLMVICGVTRW